MNSCRIGNTEDSPLRPSKGQSHFIVAEENGQYVYYQKAVSRHKQIVEEFGIEKSNVIGGGFFRYHANSKEICFYGKSGDYGAVDLKILKPLSEVVKSYLIEKETPIEKVVIDIS